MKLCGCGSYVVGALWELCGCGTVAAMWLWQCGSYVVVGTVAILQLKENHKSLLQKCSYLILINKVIKYGLTNRVTLTFIFRLIYYQIMHLRKNDCTFGHRLLRVCT